MKTILIILFTAFSYLSKAQVNISIDSLLDSEWKLIEAQFCNLNMNDSVSECSDVIDLSEKQMHLIFSSKKNVSFDGQEFYCWEHSIDTLLLSTENLSKKDRQYYIGVSDLVFILVKKDGKLYMESKRIGEYGEYGDYSYGEINRYYFVKTN